MSDGADKAGSMRVWDLPTRLFHWALVMLIALQYATGQFHVLDMRWHYWFGYATLALISFRLLWGFFGSQTSRFAYFVRGPGAIWGYVKAQLSKNPQVSVGHNPLGGWSVLALLACVGIQCLSGLFASDEIEDNGPFAGLVAQATVKLMTQLHKWNQNLLLALIALHVIAVLIHLFDRVNLITPMITGRKRLQTAQPLQFASTWLALGLLMLCAGAVGAAVWWFGV
jgi:cytochrome b